MRETAGLTLRAILRYVRARAGDAAVTRVLDLVAAEQAIVAGRARFAVNAQAFLLAASPPPGAPRQVHGYGPSEVLDRAAPPTSFDGTLVVDIASPNRYYGYLVAFCTDFFDTERRILGAYANLAAVALDALPALESAAERQPTAESLRALARRLTHAHTAGEVTSVTAEAARSVMAADSATVLLAADAQASVGGTRFALGEETRVVLHQADTAMHEAKHGTAAV